MSAPTVTPGYAAHRKVVRRFGKDDAHAIREMTEAALFEVAVIEGRCGRHESAIEAALTILAALGSLPEGALSYLTGLAVDVGAARMRELVLESPAAGLLLPYTRALAWELGIETQVALEVEEVAKGIRRDLSRFHTSRQSG